MDHDQILELVPLYALDALEGDELARVEVHVDSCDICTAELGRHLAVTTALVPDLPAPVHVWDNIEQAIAPRSSPEARTGFAPWTWVAAVAAVFALAFGGVLVGQQLASDNLGTGEGVVAAAEVAARQSGSFSGDFVVDETVVARIVVTEDGRGYVLPTDLDSLDSARTYQLWVITPDEQVISAGVLGNAPEPSTFTWTAGFAGFALSREVAGGVASSGGDIISVVTEA